MGEFDIQVAFRNKIHELTNLVLDGEADNLLGYSSACEMGIVKVQINHISIEPKLRMIFKDLFENRIGRMKDVKVTLKVDPTAKPSQLPPHKIPIGLEPFVQKKLKFLIENDIIQRVPSGVKITWISPMNPVAKYAK